MAYQEWSVVYGEQPTAAKWNILGTNDASFNDGTGIGDDAIVPDHILNDVKFHAYRTSSAQTINNNTLTDVIFNTESFDPGSDYDNATGIYTVPVTGFYQVNFNVMLLDGGDTINYAYSKIILNGETELASAWQRNDSYYRYVSLNGSAILYLTAGDQIKVQASAVTSDAGSVSVYQANAASSFSAHLLST
jgi:hypothetical protein